VITLKSLFDGEIVLIAAITI
jgi:hypothetical protein